MRYPLELTEAKYQFATEYLTKNPKKTPTQCQNAVRRKFGHSIGWETACEIKNRLAKSVGTAPAQQTQPNVHSGISNAVRTVIKLLQDNAPDVVELTVKKTDGTWSANYSAVTAVKGQVNL